MESFLSVFFSLTDVYLYIDSPPASHMFICISHANMHTFGSVCRCPLSSLEVERKSQMNNEWLAVFKPQPIVWVLWGRPCHEFCSVKLYIVAEGKVNNACRNPHSQNNNFLLINLPWVSFLISSGSAESCRCYFWGCLWRWLGEGFWVFF